MTTALGIALIVYAVVGLCAFRLAVPARGEGWLSAVVGIATGMITAATGVFVIPAVPYLQALELDKDELVQALGMSFMVSTAALAVVLVQAGSLQVEIARSIGAGDRAGGDRHGARAMAAGTVRRRRSGCASSSGSCCWARISRCGLGCEPKGGVTWLGRQSRVCDLRVIPPGT